jgi:hypothetical protein
LPSKILNINRVGLGFISSKICLVRELVRKKEEKVDNQVEYVSLEQTYSLFVFSNETSSSLTSINPTLAITDQATKKRGILVYRLVRFGLFSDGQKYQPF